VTVTEAGEAFVNRARRVLGEIDEIGEDMGRYATGSKGLVRVSAWYHVDPQLDLLRPFLADFPDISVSMFEMATPEALDGLRSGAIDLAWVLLDGESDLVDIDHIVVREEPYVLIVAPEHRLANVASASLAEVAQLPQVVLRPLTPVRNRLARAFGSLGVQPRVEIETNELAAAVAFVSIGLGAAILTRRIAEQIGRPVAFVSLVDGGTFVLSLAWRRSGQRTPAAEAALDYARRAELPRPTSWRRTAR